MGGTRCEIRSRSRGRSYSWSPTRHRSSHESRNREARGFGFVNYASPEDAAEAKRFLNHQVIKGHEIHIVFAEENRKNPDEMHFKSRKRSRHGGVIYLRNTHLHSPRWSRSYKRSESPPYRSRSISCESCSSIGRFHDSSPSIDRFHDSFSPRGRTYVSSPSRRVTHDISPPKDRLCNNSPPRSESYNSLPSRYGYCDSPPPRDGYCESPSPRDEFHDSISSRFMPRESSVRRRALNRPARRTLHGSPPFCGNAVDSSLLKSRPYHSNLFSIEEHSS